MPYPHHTRQEMSDLEKFQMDAIVEDFAANTPEVIIYDRARNMQGMGRTAFDFAEYLGRDPRYAELTRGYRYYTDVAQYRVMRRSR